MFKNRKLKKKLKALETQFEKNTLSIVGKQLAVQAYKDYADMSEFGDLVDELEREIAIASYENGGILYDIITLKKELSSLT